MNRDDLIDLYRQMEWADASVWRSVMATDTAQSDAKVRDYLYHLHFVQHTFLKTWRNEQLEMPNDRFTDARSLMLYGRGYYGEVMGQLESFDDSKLAEPVPLAWSSMIEKIIGRAPETATLGETVLQVALHSLYHRGQINARLRAIGENPPLVDYIAWVWSGRPAAVWPEQ